MPHANHCFTVNTTEHDMSNYLQERKRYDFIKSTLEETLMLLMPKLDLKDPNDKSIYDDISEAIELSDEMSSRFDTAYTENN